MSATHLVTPWRIRWRQSRWPTWWSRAAPWGRITLIFAMLQAGWDNCLLRGPARRREIHS